MVGPLCPLKLVCINDANKVNNKEEVSFDIDISTKTILI